MNTEDTYGISRISIVSMRLEPDHRSEMVNQLLFGEHYTTIKESADGKWIKVSCALDRYEGWIQKEQFHEISFEYFEQVGLSDYKICLDLFSSILFNKTHVHVTIGSILPITSNEIFQMDEHLAFNGESKSLGQKRDSDFVEQIGKKYLNAPYLWGGKSPLGIDCSGFTQMVFRISGYSIPRDSTQQAITGRHVEKLSDSHPGDLLIFNNDSGNIDHVGILLENEKVIHASGKVRIDILEPEGVKNVDTGRITHQLHSIRRVII